MGGRLRISVPLVLAALVFSFSVPGALAGEHEQSRDQWLRTFPFEVVGYFCREEMFFMECFEVTVHECTQAASTSVDVCLDYIRENLPAALDRRARELWGARLISCAGSVYEQALRKRLLFKNKGKCEDPSRWQ